MRCSVLVILTPLLATLALSQSVTVRGRVIARNKNIPLVGANIRLFNRSDSTDHHATATDSEKVSYEKIKKESSQMGGAPREQSQKPDEKKPDKPNE